MIRIRVEDNGVQSAIAALSARIKNLKPAFAEIGEEIAGTVREGFSASQSPWGARWKSIGQSAIMGRLAHRKDSFGKRGKITAKGRGYLTGGVQPLLDTGRLRNSITYRASGSGVEIGTTVPYAAIHQFGGMAGRRRRANIPARPFMPIRNGRADLPAGWQREVVGILQRRIMEAAQQ